MKGPVKPANVPDLSRPGPAPGGGRLRAILQGALEPGALSRLHERQSYDPADFLVPTGREDARRSGTQVHSVQPIVRDNKNADTWVRDGRSHEARWQYITRWQPRT